ncbi:MAG: hypothetical protein ACN4GT_06190 [Gammaproteobacteria bacterium]
MSAGNGFNALKNSPTERREFLFWFGALLGLLPALRADLLFPHTWWLRLGANYSLSPIDNPFGLLALVFAIGLASLAAASPSRARWLATLPFITILLADSFIGRALGGLNSVHVASAFVVFVYFAIAGRVLSLPFLAFVTLLVLLQSFDGLLAWPQIIVFVVGAVVMRIAVEALRQNLPLARQLGRTNRRALVGRTLSLWWPMLILIGFGLWFGSRLTSGTEELLYANGVVKPYCALDPDDAATVLACPNDALVLKASTMRYLPMPDYAPGDKIRQTCRVWAQEAIEIRTEPPPPAFVCPPRDDAKREWSLTRLPFFTSLDHMAKRRSAVSEWRLNNVIDSIDVAALQVADEVRDDADREAKKLFSVVPEETGMTTSACTFPDIKCAAANVVIDGLNDAYDNARGKAEEDFVRQVKVWANEAAESGEDATTYVTTRARKELGGQAAIFEARARQGIDRVRMAANLTGQVLLLLLIVAIIKSLLYVFARVIFDKSTDIDVDMLDKQDVAAEGKVTHLQEVTVSGDYPYDMYYKANYQPLGLAPRFSVPQWRASIMSRLRFGAWNMNWADMPMGDSPGITFNSIEAEHLVDWEMQEGEEVVFSYRNFVAMNENVELRTVISLRVATLLLGRIVFHTARCTGGPGRLILRTRGKPATAEQVSQSIPVARLVAWNRNARFSVDSHLTKADIFLNGFNLRRSDAKDNDGPRGILVVEADARDGGLLVGTLRFAKNFLLPV